MNKEEIINELMDTFIQNFKCLTRDKHLEVPELSDDVVKSIITEYLNKKTFGQARSYFYKVLDNYVEGRHSKINWSLDRSELEKTKEHISWKRFQDIDFVWLQCKNMSNLEGVWVELNGMAHSDEEAAKIAADKWCELLFCWHLQDNGAINESHGGGFPACALGTILANKSKESITEEMKRKAHELFYQYYLKAIHFNRTYDRRDIEWAKENLKDKTGNFDWNHIGSDYEMYCDYDPSWPLYLVLVNSGIEDSDANNICPWKTGIYIRKEDNAVMYSTYQNLKEL